jgi:hypothetical protein
MVSSRLRPNHKIRQASGLPRPAKAQQQPAPATLAEYFATFDPTPDLDLPQPLLPLCYDGDLHPGMTFWMKNCTISLPTQQRKTLDQVTKIPLLKDHYKSTFYPKNCHRQPTTAQ